MTVAGIAGRWVHVHEEDGPGYRMFRRAGSPLPPSRGRVELDIAPDLTARRFGPGADDRPSGAETVRVSMGGGDAGGGGEGGTLEVCDFDGERLKIRK